MRVHTPQEHRCKLCQKLLFKGVLVDSSIEVKCTRCHKMNTFTGESSSDYMCAVMPCPNRVAMPVI